MRISLDAMGGDFAPQNPCEAAVMALRELPEITAFYLVGDEPTLIAELAKLKFSDPRLKIVHTTEIIGMNESPMPAVRKKKDSSLARCIDLVKSGDADICVTAGNTGALFIASHLKLRTLKGVDRPGLACIMPGRDKRFILMDAGANLEPHPNHLVQYAYMGKLFAQEILKVKNPKVGLFSIGTEDLKGNELVLNTHQMLKGAPNLNFIGNVDGHELFGENIDVLIADAFVGNAILKTAETTFRATAYWFKKALYKNWTRKLGALLCRPAFGDIKKNADPDVFGGAVLLGLNGFAFKSHGSATATAIKNTIKLAIEFAQNHFNDLIVEEIEKNVNKVVPPQTTLPAENQAPAPTV
ncbi:MAG: phosphate acyltransferase PlsX [Verrucomicrobiota bacterium]|nr:phosphate acyltransferase PlsX [Verrucomicrobiota bacterium]